MPETLSPEERAIVEEESAQLRRVQAQLADAVVSTGAASDYDADLISLRDQLGETRAEDHAALVEHMTRLAALRATQRRDAPLPADPRNPYFAHLRLRDRHEGRERVRDVLIGRRAFIDTRRNVQIVDWRNSPISRIFYCYGEGDEYEEEFAGELQSGHVELRRTVTIDNGELVRVVCGDIILVRGPDHTWHRLSADRSRLAGGMGTAIRAPSDRLGRVGVDQRLPEITALIDPDQFRAITDQRSGTVIIRGGAGTGKTTIALHRAAWLHFHDPRRFAPKRMLIITPGDALRRYVSKVLPALDVRGVRIRTFAGWAHETVKRLVPSLKKRKRTDETPLGARRLKRHPALLKMIDKAVRDEGRGYDAELEAIGGKVLLDAWVRRRNLPTLKRLDALARWLDEDAERQLGDKRWAARKLVGRVREELADPAELWAELLTDRTRLAAAFAHWGEKPYEWELDQLVETVSQQSEDPADYRHVDASHRQGIDGRALDEGSIRGHLDVDDLAIVMRIVQLRTGRLEDPKGRPVTFEHVVVDEAQDHSPLVLQVLCEAVRPRGPVTLAGDTAQRITLDNGFADWDELVSTLKLDAHVLPPLSVTYRSTRQVMALAQHVLGHLVDDEPARGIRDGAPVELLRFDETGEAVAFLADALKSLRDRERRASVALVSRTPEVADLYYRGLARAEVPELRRVRQQDFDFSPGVDVTDVYQIKGLEYDYVVMLEPTIDQYPDTIEARHLFHVAATRAAHQLWLVASGRPSPLLPASLLDPLAAEPAEAES